MRLTLEQIAQWMDAEPMAGVAQQAATGYSIDSRTLQPGDLFFAVVGERLNGHDYVEAALQAGAVAAVVARAELPRFSASDVREP